MRQCPRCSIIADDNATYCPHDGTRLDDLPAPSGPDEALIGEEVGHYRVTALLGSGGMGAVYLGVHPTIGSRVAIKVLHPEMARDREAVRRFFAEARAVNLIHHENIINIIDLAELSDGRSYIIMEYLEGESLGARLRAHGPLDPDEAIGLMLPLLAALQAAHERGVIHRDLKPDNVFLTRGGQVKVLDFGIAKLEPLAGESSLTQTGAIIGTPIYMSPEQATGRTSEMDRRTDIYSAGVLLYEMLAGRTPFKAGTLMELISKHLLEPPPPLRAQRPAIPAELEAVVIRALAKEPAARWDNAAEMAAALRRAQRARDDARPAIPPTRRGDAAEVAAASGRPRGTRRVLVLAVAGACLFLGAGGFAWWWRAAGSPAARAGSSAVLRRRVDAALVAANEPVPPASCSATDRRVLLPLAEAAEALRGGTPRGGRQQDEEAVIQLQAATDLGQGVAEYFYLLGRARLFAGRDLDGARDAARSALTRCDEFPAAHNLAGTIAFVAGRDEEALREYDRAAALDPTYVTPKVNRGLVLLRLGRVPEATTALNEVVARAPGRAEARVARGQAHLLAGQTAAAVTDLEAAVKVAPEDAMAQLLLGEAYARDQRPRDAQAAYCRARALGNARGAALCADGGVPAPVSGPGRPDR